MSQSTRTVDGIPAARKRCFDPVVDERTRVLVLGSLPGEQSLARQEYYGNTQNQLWPILSALAGEDLVGQPYDERLSRLLAHRIGLWDVLGACERAGSLDSAIRKPAANDFERLRALCPLLETVGFNGQTAGKFAPQFALAGYQTVVLPSTSPAHASFSFEQKLARWRSLMGSHSL
jgi:hypoxanthine-DNA glycosylase